MPAIMGKDELKAWFEKRFSTYSAEIEKSIDEIEIFGNWAFERGRETSRIRSRATNEVEVVKGKFINIFKKQSDGSWKVARRIRNFDHPI
jgi:ketosteroid isomerase-like protein